MEVPLLKGAYNNDVDIIGIGFQDGQKNIEKFAKDLTMPWPVIFDKGTKIGKAYGISFGAGTVFINKKGTISGMLVAGFSQEELDAKVSMMLNPAKETKPTN